MGKDVSEKNKILGFPKQPYTRNNSKFYFQNLNIFPTPFQPNTALRRLGKNYIKCVIISYFKRNNIIKNFKEKKLL